MRLIPKFLLISLPLNFLLSYLWKFQNYELTLTPSGIYINLFLILPGILPFFLKRNVLKTFIDVSKRIGTVRLYVISLVYNFILFSGILTVGLIFKIISFDKSFNIETQLLGLLFDIPLYIAIWLPSIYPHEFAWRSFILDNKSNRTDISKVIESAIIWSISFSVISFYFILQNNIIFGLSFLISQFLNGVALNMFYIKSRSLWLCSFHHILFIVLNSFIFGSIFQDGVIFNERFGILNANGGIGVIMQIFLIILLFFKMKNIKISNSSN